MVSTFTPNIQLEEPARGDDVGTWDTPVNANMSLIDKVVGSVVTIGLNNSPVVLAAAQYQARAIIFNSTLTGNVTITFPTSFIKDYIIYNLTTGSSAFTIRLQSGAGLKICIPPSEGVNVLNDGGSLLFLNLGRIGSYVDYAGSSLPLWVTGCDRQPYLNCDGTAFSSALYPDLSVILGGTTLPDRRGTAGYTLNQGTGRIIAVNGGLDGNTAYATKFTDTVTIGTSNLPPYTPAGSVTVTSSDNVPHNVNSGVNPVAASGTAVLFGGTNGTLTSCGSLAGTPQGGVSDPMSAIGTGTVYGICMIRSGW
jgi:hypothetical protein